MNYDELQVACSLAASYGSYLLRHQFYLALYD
jgi:hypothetical protein